MPLVVDRAEVAERGVRSGRVLFDAAEAEPVLVELERSSDVYAIDAKYTLLNIREAQ